MEDERIIPGLAPAFSPARIHLQDSRRLRGELGLLHQQFARATGNGVLHHLEFVLDHVEPADAVLEAG